jgi:antitoxin component of RelBE/YafQ-DinJ toxin-antitoxin module
VSDGTPAAPSSNAAPAAGGAAPSTPTPAKAPEAPKPLSIKGHTFKSEDDAFAEIERGRQSGKLLTEAQKRLMEASRKEKDWEGLVSEVKTKKDARKVIERLGLSKEEAVEVFGRWLYQEEVVAKEMSPEQRRIKELEAEKAKFEEERAAETRKRQEAENEQLTKREEAKLREELTKVLEAKKVPATRLALRRLANYMASYAEAGADVPVERAADMVMEDYKQEYGEMFDEATPDQLIEFFGKSRWHALARKVSDWALSRARGNISPMPQEPLASRKAKTEEKMTPAEFQQFLKGAGK